ncbi:hypothetical protein H9P43_003253 [Blastocladiella emersonii ATCC 22665]|nr:hypothetical protein H9P43_003253 [Blastocladiella emersonii ATCC 22665]
MARTRLSPVACLALAAVLLASLAGHVDAQCRTVRTRKPLSSLSSAEWKALNDGFWAMKRNGALDRLTRRHRTGMAYHGTPHFFPMHRALMADFEDELLKVAPTLTGAPYWDELREGSGIQNSDVFGPTKLSPMASGPLRGVFAGLRDDGGNLVMRDPQRLPTGFSWLPPSQVLARAMARFTNFGDFARIVEVSPHNQFHILVGGHMGDTRISPSDPAFWVNHAYIDALWAIYQSLRPQNVDDLRGWGNPRGIDPAARVVVYPERWTYRDMLRYRTRLCYQYVVPTQQQSLKKRGVNETVTTTTVASAAGNGTTTSTTTTTTTTSYTYKNGTAAAAPAGFFPLMYQAPDEAVYKVMPNMSIDNWRAIEKEINTMITDLNTQIAKGQVDPAALPTVNSLFLDAHGNCTAPPEDDYSDSAIPAVQDAALQLQSSAGPSFRGEGAVVVVAVAMVVSVLAALV